MTRWRCVPSMQRGGVGGGYRENVLRRCSFHLNTVNTALQGIMGGQSECEQTGGLFMYSLKTEVIFSDLTTWLRPRHPEERHDGRKSDFEFKAENLNNWNLNKTSQKIHMKTNVKKRTNICWNDSFCDEETLCPFTNVRDEVMYKCGGAGFRFTGL